MRNDKGECMKGQKKTYFNYFVDVSMVAAILVVAVTGVIKLPWLIDFFSIDLAKIPFEEISLVHDIAGLVITFLIILHIVLHFKWFIVITKNVWKKRQSPLRLGVVVGLVVVLGVIVYSFAIVVDTTKALNSSEEILIVNDTDQINDTNSYEGIDKYYSENKNVQSQNREQNQVENNNFNNSSEESTVSSSTFIENSGIEMNIEGNISSEIEDSDLISALPENVAKNKYIDGVYTGSARGFKSTIKVEVIVENGLINTINVLSHRESRGYYEEVFDTFPTEVVEKQSTDLDIITGATYTSRGFLNAVENALEEAIVSDKSS